LLLAVLIQGKNAFKQSIKIYLQLMDLKQLNILLADDDIDDCMFFKMAVDDFPSPTRLTIVHDGEKLMEHLTCETNELPHILFLDLNMHRKNGFECLSEIKASEKLLHLPVIMFSTSFEQGVVNQLYENGAQYFIRKPSEFSQFKQIIQQTLTVITQETILSQPSKENFVLTLQPPLTA
jgi:CheY-like chemotaxis protein